MVDFNNRFKWLLLLKRWWGQRVHSNKSVLRQRNTHPNISAEVLRNIDSSADMRETILSPDWLIRSLYHFRLPNPAEMMTMTTTKQIRVSRTCTRLCTHRYTYTHSVLFNCTVKTFGFNKNHLWSKIWASHILLLCAWVAEYGTVKMYLLHLPL